MTTKLGITMGDPLGIGPEVLIKALYHGDFFSLASGRGLEVILYAAPSILEQAPGPELGHIQERLAQAGIPLHIHAPPSLRPDKPRGCPGAPDHCSHHIQSEQGPTPPATAGRIALGCLQDAVSHLHHGAIDALVTGPVDKHRIASGNSIPFRGQTEYLAARFGRREDQVAMVLAGDNLRVALATTHLPLASVSSAITLPHLVSRLQVLVEGLQERWRIPAPRIAVCALNPHAGDHRLFGDEEEEIIAPAIDQLRRQGHQVCGPYPADSLFASVVHGNSHDAVMAMYHDQGLVPLKMWEYRRAANVTLGLPGAIRTSPDHGTADDIAGSGKADHSSMEQAIRMALQFCMNREKEERSPLVSPRGDNSGERSDCPSPSPHFQGSAPGSSHP